MTSTIIYQTIQITPNEDPMVLADIEKEAQNVSNHESDNDDDAQNAKTVSNNEPVKKSRKRKSNTRGTIDLEKSLTPTLPPKMKKRGRSSGLGQTVLNTNKKPEKMQLNTRKSLKRNCKR